MSNQYLSAEESRFIMSVAEESFVACDPDTKSCFNVLVFHLNFPWTWFSNLSFEPTNSSESEITGITVLLAGGHSCWRAAILIPWDMSALCLMTVSPRMLNWVLKVFVAELISTFSKEFLCQICRYVVQLCWNYVLGLAGS